MLGDNIVLGAFTSIYFVDLYLKHHKRFNTPYKASQLSTTIQIYVYIQGDICQPNLIIAIKTNQHMYVPPMRVLKENKFVL